MAEQSAHEPTMEEILASIRRIISEDDAPADEAAAAEPEADAFEVAEAEPVVGHEAEEEEDVLELTQPFEPSQGTVSIGDIDAYEPEPEVAPAPAPKPVAKAPSAPSAGLVSKHTEAAAMSAFGSLTSNLLVPKSDRTLEDVTRDLLRPLLQAWLDENLPNIVEEQVRIEVERISRQGRG
jgi:cell pole-organizing protein PopZ